MRRALFLLAIVAALAGCSAAPRRSPVAPSLACTPPTEPERLVEYRVTGTGRVMVTYADEFQHFVTVQEAPVPWSLVHRRAAGLAYLQATQLGEGCLLVQIWRGGVLGDEGRACRQFQTVTISRGWF